MNDLVRELRELRGLEGLCADGCWGRCRVCPADAVQKAADRIESLQSRLAGVEKLLRRYRDETPLGHQPHMIAHEVDAALAQTAKET